MTDDTQDTGAGERWIKDAIGGKYLRHADHCRIVPQCTCGFDELLGSYHALEDLVQADKARIEVAYAALQVLEYAAYHDLLKPQEMADEITKVMAALTQPAPAEEEFTMSELGPYERMTAAEQQLEQAKNEWADYRRLLSDIMPVARAGLVGLNRVGNEGVYRRVENAQTKLDAALTASPAQPTEEQ